MYRGRRITEPAPEVASAITVPTFASSSLTPEEQRKIIRLLRKLG